MQGAYSLRTEADEAMALERPDAMDISPYSSSDMDLEASSGDSELAERDTTQLGSRRAARSEMARSLKAQWKHSYPLQSAAQWEPYRARLRELYIDLNLPLHLAKQAIEYEYGFLANLYQYCHQVRTWGWDQIKANMATVDAESNQKRKLTQNEPEDLSFFPSPDTTHSDQFESWRKRRRSTHSEIYGSSTP